MYALVDGNNFYVSCERVFRPDLNGRPVIVLSNNDGCAIARSNEAKALGVKMGAPWLGIRHLEEKEGRLPARCHGTPAHAARHPDRRAAAIPLAVSLTARWADGRISSIALAADPMRLLSRISRHWFRTAVTGLFHRIFISMKRGEWLPILWDCLAVFLLRRTSTVAVQARCWKLTRARARSLATQMFTWSALPLSRR